MACQTPVVATRVGLVPDVIEDGVNGFSAPADDARSLAEALVLLASDRNNASRIGIRARASAEKHSWTRNLTPLGDVYKKYLRTAPNQTATAAWMRHPESLTGPAHAADVIVNAWDDCHKFPGRRRAIFNAMMCGLEGLSAADIVRGTALLKRLDFVA